MKMDALIFSSVNELSSVRSPFGSVPYARYYILRKVLNTFVTCDRFFILPSLEDDWDRIE